jgi:hypothetical protein
MRKCNALTAALEMHQAAWIRLTGKKGTESKTRCTDSERLGMRPPPCRSQKTNPAEKIPPGYKHTATL